LINVVSLWELPNGKYHREIHDRQGLKLS